MASHDLKRLRAWAAVPEPEFLGGNQVDLLQGGDELFPSMCQAIHAAQREIWLATYIFHNDPAASTVQAALADAAARGVAVHVVVDGFGSLATLAGVRRALQPSGVQLEVFRPLERWYAWLQPGQLRRLHQKLCVCDEAVAFVGGINIIDDRNDLNHGWASTPRLDFAVAVRGPLAQSVHATVRAMWARAHMVRAWREEVRAVAHSRRPVKASLQLLGQLRGAVVAAEPGAPAELQPVRAAFIVRDNLRQRRAIERSYVQAIRGARTRVDIAVPYFYPGRGFRRALTNAARRGVRVRLLLQGKVDFRIAGLAARAVYDEMHARGVHIYEYMPAFLHAKMALVDDDWATVGSSNIDPLSLLLNLEANVVVRDARFTQALAQHFEVAFAASEEVQGPPARAGWRGWLLRAAIAWVATVYLRVAGITGRY